jgi:hypothetical protein
MLDSLVRGIMLKLRDYVACALAVGSGLSVLIVIPAITGDPEAWNGGLYWKAAMSLLALECGIMGYFVPERWWHWELLQRRLKQL